MSSRPLTNRETQMLGLLADGLKYKQIAHQTGLGVSTVRTHVHNIYAKLGVYDRAQAVLTAQRSGVLPPHPDDQNAGAEDLRVRRALTDLVAELVALLRDERRDLLTSRQHAYLDAFRRALRTGDPLDLAIERHTFEGLCEEADLQVPSHVPSLAQLAEVTA